MAREDVDYCRGKAKVYGVSDAYRMAPWLDVVYSADHRWWVSTPVGRKEPNYVATSRLRAQRVTCDPGTAQLFGLRYVPHSPGKGRAPNGHVRGCHSGEEAINLVANDGAKRIVLLGFDMGATGNGHWFGDHPETVSFPGPHGTITEPMNTTNREQFLEWCAEMAYLAKDLKREGIEVINCTRKTWLNCFPCASILETL